MPVRQRVPRFCRLYRRKSVQHPLGERPLKNVPATSSPSISMKGRSASTMGGHSVAPEALRQRQKRLEDAVAMNFIVVAQPPSAVPGEIHSPGTAVLHNLDATR